MQIFEAGGERLIETLPLDEPVTVDLCDRHRQDYFLVYDLKIPARIGLGPHVMKLTVEDRPRRPHRRDPAELHGEVADGRGSDPRRPITTPTRQRGTRRARPRSLADASGCNSLPVGGMGT